MGRKLYVGNLPDSTTEQDLSDKFAAYGTVESVKLITDRDTGRSRGFGFIEMASEAEAQAAIDTRWIVSLAKGAYVEGNIFCARVLIEDGARFKGKIDTGEPPKVTAVAKEPLLAEPVSTKTPPKVAGQTAKSSVY